MIFYFGRQYIDYYFVSIWIKWFQLVNVLKVLNILYPVHLQFHNND